MVILGFHKRKGPIVWVIRFLTVSTFDHCSIRINDSIWDARLFSGVERRTKHPNNEYIEEFKVLGLTELDERRLEYWLDNQVGKKYDIWSILKFFTQSQEARKSRRRFFCSEIIAAAFIHINKPLLLRCPPYKTSPGMLNYSPFLSFLRIIKT